MLENVDKLLQGTLSPPTVDIQNLNLEDLDFGFGGGSQILFLVPGEKLLKLSGTF